MVIVRPIHRHRYTLLSPNMDRVQPKMAVTQARVDELVQEILNKPAKRMGRMRVSRRRSTPLPCNWEELRALVMARDGMLCVDCGGVGHGVHHVDYNREHNGLPNLVYLCWLCHRKRHHRRA